MTAEATDNSKARQLVYTVKDRCRVCYTCVRECPVKAIRIVNGQAQIIPERCIACGNCTRVCSQGAKAYLRAVDEVAAMLDTDRAVACCLAPSFPAEFQEIMDSRILVGMLRQLGFRYVVEVAFGADLVAAEYKKLLNGKQSKHYINSDCPAIVNYVRYYFPKLIDSLVPVVSPMIATARVIRKQYGNDIRIVFVGPCIAKKNEVGEVDQVLTFVELRELLTRKKIKPAKVTPSGFDPPIGGKGALFPISRGLFRNIDIDGIEKEDKIIVAEGQEDFKELISEFDKGLLGSSHLELLCCRGCIMGPGMSPNGLRYARRANINDYNRRKMRNFDTQEWKENLQALSDLDLRQKFQKAEKMINMPNEDQIKQVLHSMNKYSDDDYLNCGACGYSTCREHAVAIVQGLAENEMCLPYTIDMLHNSINDLNHSNRELADAKEALKQTEKLASMGQLSAGIAHELNNPLGVITMYSNLLLDELADDNPSRKDIELIVEQAERCRKIVGGLLNFARKNQVRLVETNIEKFTQRSIESVIKPETVSIIFNSYMKNQYAMIDTDQMMQVLTNLEKNAVEAMPDGGTLTVELSDTADEITIKVKDTGIGIPEENMDKMFTPFFTTKERGKGTGLGLSLVYGIVKMHRGKIAITSNTSDNQGQKGTEITITLPRNILN